ncbi:MAG TPA: twin-arginine translocase subunit TatC [Thermoguttaceae bacterium]|nr:twin-arginine translocase subunit TatC [Thermoguttaceae bacterium]
MTFGEHLEELRSCLFKAIVGLAIGFVFGLMIGGDVVEWIQIPLKNALTAYYEKQSEETVLEKIDQLKADGYQDDIAEIIARKSLLPEEVFVSRVELARKLGIDLQKDVPDTNVADTKVDGTDADTADEDIVAVFLWHKIADDIRVRTTALNAHEAFTIFIKAALLVGAILASPWIFYQIWAFVAAGLYPHEKKYIHFFLPISLGLFLAGAALAFFFVFEPVLNFLFSFNDWLKIDPDPRISEWLGFVLILPLGFGVSFQLPLVMLFLERIGIFDVQAYLTKWRIAILVIFILSMFLTPADPTSMLLMAGPLTILYFGGILLCHFLPRSQSPFDSLDEE